MKGYGKAVRDKLLEAGCRFARHAKGDHDIWLTPDGKRLTVPVKIMSRHTSGMPRTKSSKMRACRRRFDGCVSAPRHAPYFPLPACAAHQGPLSQRVHRLCATPDFSESS
jgi:hypothetical protein